MPTSIHRGRRAATFTGALVAPRPSTDGPAATPDHPRFPSVRASQDELRCSGRRVVALDLLSVSRPDAINKLDTTDPNWRLIAEPYRFLVSNLRFHGCTCEARLAV